MKRASYRVCFFAVFSLIFFVAAISLAEENKPDQPQAETPAAPSPAIAEAPVTPAPDIQAKVAAPEANLTTNPEAETQWLWGEVVMADPQAKTLTVKYLDYDTETEKQITISVDDKTTYENANSLAEIKPQQTVSVDYILAIDGNNLAKNISLEQAESEDMGADFNEMAPAQVPPQIPPIEEERTAP